MNRYVQAIFIVTVLVLFLGLGYLGSNVYNDIQGKSGEQKPVAEIKEKRNIVTDDTQVIYEQEFIKCGHVVISEFGDKDNLIGKSLSDIRRIYSSPNGYSIKMEDDALIIRQSIDDWCPADKERYRLKEYKGRVAIYKGPKENDILQKVTNIYMNSLPEEEQVKIRRGDYEFKNEEVLKDALENFDEYL